VNEQQVAVPITGQSREHRRKTKKDLTFRDGAGSSAGESRTEQEKIRWGCCESGGARRREFDHVRMAAGSQSRADHCRALVERRYSFLCRIRAEGKELWQGEELTRANVKDLPGDLRDRWPESIPNVAIKKISIDRQSSRRHGLEYADS